VKVRKELRLFTYHGAPVVAHWSVLLAFPIGWSIQKSIIGALVAQVAFLALMLAHELGHAFVARCFRLPIHSLELYAIHGLCRHGAPRRERQAVAIAWGGVAAQGAVFALALLLAKGLNLSGGIPRALAPAFDVWVPANMLIAFCNLLPIAPLDGAKAWRFVPFFLSGLVRRIRSWCRRPAARVVSMELRRIGKREGK
jgi:Zn-dependent protease